MSWGSISQALPAAVYCQGQSSWGLDTLDKLAYPDRVKEGEVKGDPDLTCSPPEWSPLRCTKAVGRVLCHGPRSRGVGVAGRATNKRTGPVHLVVTNRNT